MKSVWPQLLAALAIAGTASAQVTEKCRGEKWAEISARRLGDEKLGPILAIFNRAAGSERCPDGKFVRLPIAIKHTVQPGQTIENIALRFLRAPGGPDLLRSKNGIQPGMNPAPGTAISIPSEVPLDLGKKPDAAFAAFAGIAERDEVLRYNGLPEGKLPAGRMIYVPVFLSAIAKAAPPAVAAKPPPAAPKPTPAPAATATVTATPAPSVATPKRTDLLARADRFPHAFHLNIIGAAPAACDTCHIPDGRRPGTYFPVPPGVCSQCHTNVAAPDATGVRTTRLPLAFSHDLHLNPARAVAKDYTPPDCTVCHAEGKDGLRRTPAHAECEKCHNKTESKLAVEEHCSGCHLPAEQEDHLDAGRALLATHLAQSVRGTNVRFAHEAHLAAGATCDGCHEGARTAERIEEIEPMRMADCLECHRGLQKIAADTIERLDTCQACHFSRSIAASPSFSAVVDKPLSHTLRFRKSHGAVAREDDVVCQSCHAPLAGGSGGDCNRCHAVMRPADHGVRWREESHGRAAVRDPERCETCHLRDRCADCHRLAPRDHFPRAAFVQAGHGRRARVSVGRCQTCHMPAIDCARCHDVAAR